MTFEQLRVFVEVAAQLHMTRAAERLNMTQPAVSASVAALEAGCGTHLFHRVGRRIELTEAGQVFLVEAQAILERVSRAEAVLNDISGLRRGSLSVHASQTIANYWLGPRLARYRLLHPGIAIKVEIGNTAEGVAALLDGQADLAFVEGGVSEAPLVRLAVPGDRLVLVVGRDHPWAGRADLAPADLLATDWVLRESGSGTRQVFEDGCRAYGVDPKALTVALEFPSNEAVLSAVAAGAGATVISELVVGAGLATGQLCLVPMAFPERPFFILRHVDRYRSRAEEALLELIRGDRKG
ncbi:LysR substrate-binding domain-containing protein [Aquabacter cavernae]|uniref:LysR substrate-binding domain-containing protein n=1 Tax=Aquabacter cavernae TaxID=2496029 RepID=UPI000F8EC3FF|nr:LysR substrate-binding domain-containing protein [Aquabacter cavernae]